MSMGYVLKENAVICTSTKERRKINRVHGEVPWCFIMRSVNGIVFSSLQRTDNCNLMHNLHKFFTWNVILLRTISAVKVAGVTGTGCEGSVLEKAAEATKMSSTIAEGRARATNEVAIQKMGAKRKPQ